LAPTLLNPEDFAAPLCRSERLMTEFGRNRKPFWSVFGQNVTEMWTAIRHNLQGERRRKTRRAAKMAAMFAVFKAAHHAGSLVVHRSHERSG